MLVIDSRNSVSSIIIVLGVELIFAKMSSNCPSDWSSEARLFHDSIEASLPKIGISAVVLLILPSLIKELSS